MTGLTPVEQSRVRTALRFLRARTGTWEPLGKALGFKATFLPRVVNGDKAASPALAFAVARFAGCGVDALLAGEFPPAGTCPHCGHVLDESASNQADPSNGHSTAATPGGRISP